MRVKPISLFLFCLPLHGVMPVQETEYHSLQEAIDFHVKELKSHVNRYDNIFITVNLKNVSTSDKIRIVESGLNAKFLQSRDQNFLVDVRIDAKSNNTKVYVSNFRVLKKSNTQIELLNLNNGNTYNIR